MAEASYWAEVTVREQWTLSLPPEGRVFCCPDKKPGGPPHGLEWRVEPSSGPLETSDPTPPPMCPSADGQQRPGPYPSAKTEPKLSQLGKEPS